MEAIKRRLARRAANGQRGITLLEIMIVLAIIGLVMALLVGPQVLDRLKESKESLAKTGARKLAYEAYGQWAVSNPSKSCPDKLGDLYKYMSSESVKDPWESEFIMLCGDQLPAGAKGIGIVSPGPDKKANTPDDVKSWDEEKK
jgi:general secretion pathway protein G